MLVPRIELSDLDTRRIEQTYSPPQPPVEPIWSSLVSLAHVILVAVKGRPIRCLRQNPIEHRTFTAMYSACSKP